MNIKINNKNLKQNPLSKEDFAYLKDYDFIQKLFEQGKILPCKEYKENNYCNSFYLGKFELNYLDYSTGKAMNANVIICVNGTMTKGEDEILTYCTHPDRKQNFKNVCTGCKFNKVNNVPAKGCTDYHLKNVFNKSIAEPKIIKKSPIIWVNKELTINKKTGNVWSGNLDKDIELERVVVHKVVDLTMEYENILKKNTLKIEELNKEIELARKRLEDFDCKNYSTAILIKNNKLEQ